MFATVKWYSLRNSQGAIKIYITTDLILQMDIDIIKLIRTF